MRPVRGKPNRVQGFTLVEMLTTLIILAVLITIALPGYEFILMKSARAGARTALMEVLARQERFFINHKRYALELPSLGLPNNLFVDSQGQSVPSESAAYHIRLDVIDKVYHGVLAEPMNRQVNDAACMNYSLSRIGVRSVSGTLSLEDPAQCW